MELLLVALAWLLGLTLLATPVIAIIAFARTREVERLRQRVVELERKVSRWTAPTAGERGTNEDPAAIALPKIPSHLSRPARSEPEAQPTPAPTPSPAAASIQEAQPAPPNVASSPEPTAPPAANQPAARPMAPATPRQPIDWERWLGVRGAAIVGGISLVVAGLLFFQYAIAHGYFGPGLRIAVGSLLGIALLLAKSPLERRDLSVLSDVLAGAGAVLLYGAAWASYRLYDFIPLPVSFAWMAAVTVLTAILAVRHNSQLIALFGLIGGFATPILLSSGENRPISLFGYILLLDVGLLAIARKQRWPLLGLLGIVGTTILQAGWVVTRMEPEQARLGLAILGAFALLFAAGTAHARDGEDSKKDKHAWLVSQTAGVLVPFLFGLYFAARADLGASLTPLAVLLGLLVAAAAWISRSQGRVELVLASAVASVGVCLAWTVNSLGEAPVLWPLAIAGPAIAGVLVVYRYFCGALEDRADRTWFERPEGPAAAAILGFLATLFVAASSNRLELALAPLATGAGLLGALALMLDTRGALRHLVLVVALGVGSVLAVYAAQSSEHGFSGDSGALPLALTLVGFTAAFLGLHIWRQSSSNDSTLGPRLALAVVPLVAPTLLALVPWTSSPGAAPVQHLVLVFALATLGALGAARARSAIGYLGLVLTALFALTRWNVDALRHLSADGSVTVYLAWQAATLAALVWLPALGRGVFRLDGWVLRAALCTLVLWAVPVNWLKIDEVFESRTIWIQFAALAAIAAVGTVLVRARRDGPREITSNAFTLYAAVTAGFAVFSLAHWNGVEWVPLGAALAGAAWAWIARVRDHDKLGIAAATALVASAAGLGALAFVPNHFERSTSLVFNSLAMAYGVPAVCALFFVWTRRDVSRQRALTTAVGASAVLLVFALLNLAVLNAYGTGDTIRFEWQRVQDRDLVQSLAWAVFALLLLGIGTARRIDGLRWMSLAFQVATIAKVFLYDLGELTGLYRIGSIAGLAVCLLVVSLLYQRFVFGGSRPDVDASRAQP
ncbi:MAG: DUF2339 domain-containing protein [bacterium]|nr:DUF2339 domain-containing protein [bacterium]